MSAAAAVGLVGMEGEEARKAPPFSSVEKAGRDQEKYLFVEKEMARVSKKNARLRFFFFLVGFWLCPSFFYFLG